MKVLILDYLYKRNNFEILREETPSYLRIIYAKVPI